MKLLERDDLLSTLHGELQRAIAGSGSLVFIEGEAGIGKTALLKAFADRHIDKLPVRWGACDALHTPRPLGPLHDIASQAASELHAILHTDTDRLRAFAAFLDLLASRPSAVLIEDLHWADEATLDLIRYVGRRIARTRSLVLASYRSDEVVASHPLRLVLGDLATSGVRRHALAPLSLDAVREQASNRQIDVPELHRRTGGNPFFVTEVLATGGQDVPGTVRDAVLSRAARLRPSARAILDAAAVAGPRVEPWLLQDLTAAEAGSVDECLATGVLRAEDNVYVFRHELARQVILQTLTPTRLVSLHRLVLQALRSPHALQADLARLAHHAEGAGDGDAVLELAPAAAREASARGAHQQAAQQFARALRHATAPSALRAALLDDYSSECQLAGSLEEAIAARGEAATRWKEEGNAMRQAIALARKAHLLVIAGRNDSSETVLREALRLAGENPGSESAVVTRRWAAYIRMLDRDLEEAIREGYTGLSLAERLGDRESAVHCLNTIGSSMIVKGDVDAGCEHLEKSRVLAERMGSDFWVCNALGNLGTACGEAYRFDIAEDYLRRGIAFATERDIDYSRLYQSSWLALVRLYRGDWNEASEVAHLVLNNRRSPAIARMMALIALGRLRARRGDPGAWEALDEARALAGGSGTLQRVAPMLAARAEAAWLEGRGADAAKEPLGGVQLAVAKRHAWFTAELLYWASSDADAGPVAGEFPEFCASLPFALERNGQWQEAAESWRALHCPYEAARAMAIGDEKHQLEALAIFESLGARPMAERVRHRLRSAGVKGIPRGPRASTRGHPAGLTSKEVAVLSLLAQGLRNREIGQRLNRSARTIDHHLAAIFGKLGVATRAEAVSAAYRLGVISESSD